MKFRFDRNAMISEISIAQEIISTKNALSVLSNVLFIAENNTLTIKATDIKVNFQTKIPVDIEEEGSTTILCDKFMGILNSVSRNATILSWPSSSTQLSTENTILTACQRTNSRKLPLQKKFHSLRFLQRNSSR